MERLTTGLAAGFALLVALLVPAGYLALGYQSQRALLATEVSVSARLLNQALNASPALWPSDRQRLQSLLRPEPEPNNAEARSLADTSGTLVAQMPGAVAEPLITETAQIRDARGVVGVLTVSRSLRPLLWETLALAVAALLVAGGAFFALRILPQRAMRAAIDAARRQSERASQSEARFRVLWQTSPDAIVMVDTHNCIRYANPAVQGVFGYAPEEVVGQDLSILQPEGLAQHHRRGMLAYMESGQRKLNWSGVETTARRKSGEVFAVEIVFSEIRLDGEQVFAGFIRDISARKRAEATIRENEERLFKIFHVTPVANGITIAHEGIFLDVNDRFAELFGHTREEMIGHTASELVLWAEPEVRQVIMADLQREGILRDRYARLMRKDGSVRDMRFSMALTTLPGNDHPMIVASFEDVTERLHVQRTLEENERRYRLLFEANPQPMFVYDWETLRILSVNLAAMDCYGYSREEFLSMPIQRLRLNADEAFFLQDRTPFSESAERRFSTHVTKTGEVIDIELFSHGLKVGGRLARMVMCSNITESKRAKRQIEQLNLHLEERVRERTAALEALNDELQAFSYSVSHDLRAPVRHINAFAQIILAEQVLTGENQDYLERISRSAQRMGTLIDDLLQLSRASRVEMQVRAVAVAQLLADIREECMRDCANRSIEWRLGEIGDVLADEGLLRVVLVNLLANAVKFTARVDPARIEVDEVPGQPGEVVLCVRDNGAGFDMRYADKLFGVFERLHSEQEFAGTGIGLATVRRLVQRLGGRVWAQGEIGQGAMFFVALPRARAQA